MVVGREETYREGEFRVLPSGSDADYVPTELGYVLEYSLERGMHLAPSNVWHQGRAQRVRCMPGLGRS